MKERKDDYLSRKSHLASLNDLELKTYFFELADKIVDPLLHLGYENTSKSIERSILLRMGFSSLDATKIVDILNEHNLLRKGSGHCVYRISKDKKVSIEDAGETIIAGDGIEYLLKEFKSHGKIET